MSIKSLNSKSGSTFWHFWKFLYWQVQKVRLPCWFLPSRARCSCLAILEIQLNDESLMICKKRVKFYKVKQSTIVVFLLKIWGKLTDCFLFALQYLAPRHMLPQIIQLFWFHSGSVIKAFETVTVCECIYCLLFLALLIFVSSLGFSLFRKVEHRHKTPRAESVCFCRPMDGQVELITRSYSGIHVHANQARQTLLSQWNSCTQKLIWCSPTSTNILV